MAVLAAYKDMSAPWKELLNYYQRVEDVRIKYEQVVEPVRAGGHDPLEQLAEMPRRGSRDGRRAASQSDANQPAGCRRRPARSSTAFPSGADGTATLAIVGPAAAAAATRW